MPFSLHQPRPELGSESLRRLLVVGISLNLSNTTDEVHFSGLDPLGLLDDLESDPKDGEEDDRQVGGQEVGSEGLVSGDEGGPSREEQDDGDTDDTVPSSETVLVQPGVVREVGLGHTLGLHTGVESDVQQTDTPPG